MSASCDGSRSPDSQNFAARSLTLARKASSAAVLRGHRARAAIAKPLRDFGEQLGTSVPDLKLDGSATRWLDSDMTQTPTQQHRLPNIPATADHIRAPAIMPRRANELRRLREIVIPIGERLWLNDVLPGNAAGNVETEVEYARAQRSRSHHRYHLFRIGRRRASRRQFAAVLALCAANQRRGKPGEDRGQQDRGTGDRRSRRRDADAGRARPGGEDSCRWSTICRFTSCIIRRAPTRRPIVRSVSRKSR
jgi:hypothetical protein